LAVSDPIDFPVAAQSDLSIFIYLKQGQQGFANTSRPGTRTTSWIGNADLRDVYNISPPEAQSVAH
jgi:hypothetical protein